MISKGKRANESPECNKAALPVPKEIKNAFAEPENSMPNGCWRPTAHNNRTENKNRGIPPRVRSDVDDVALSMFRSTIVACLSGERNLVQHIAVNHAKG